MTLAGEYQRQFRWRDWGTALAALPPVAGRTILDLGCGPGDLAAELAGRGARVVGIDRSAELLRAADARRLPNAEFRRADLRTLDLDVVADGIWASFAAAYFPDLPPVLAVWGRHLRPGGWIALTELDDLFGHAPLSAAAQELFAAYARDAFAAGRYDFHMGEKLAGHLEHAGFRVSKELTLADQEFSGSGPVPPDVVDAWRDRFERMTPLRAFAGERYDALRDEFLASLTDPRHHTTSQVQCVIATKDEG